MKHNKDITRRYFVRRMRKHLRDLGSKNEMKRRKARLALVNIGEPAIDLLAELAVHPDWIIRWEAINTLSQIRNVDTAPIFINALDDDFGGIRWHAVEGIVALGKEGLIALLQALASNKLTIPFKESAYYILIKFSNRYKFPDTDKLIHSLLYNDGFFKVQVQARSILNILQNNIHH
jgi:HEAT repeat protein